MVKIIDAKTYSIFVLLKFDLFTAPPPKDTWLPPPLRGDTGFFSGGAKKSVFGEFSGPPGPPLKKHVFCDFFYISTFKVIFM